MPGDLLREHLAAHVVPIGRVLAADGMRFFILGGVAVGMCAVESGNGGGSFSCRGEIVSVVSGGAFVHQGRNVFQLRCSDSSC